MSIILYAMKKLKKILRVFLLVVLIILATFGMGVVGNFLTGSRERYMDKRITTEQTDRKEESDEDSEDEKN